MASLRETQRSFAAALRDPSVACAVLPAANLAIYRNNASVGFRVALERTYPVLRRRVGDDYFRQLAQRYRERFPSRSGDLHWVGREFAAFLDDHLRDGDYAWLADLARLEWARAECTVGVESPAVAAEALTRFGSHELERLVFHLQPTLRLHSFAYPIFTVWEANQSDGAPPVDQFLGTEYGMSRVRHEFPEVRRLGSPLFAFVSALFRQAPLGEAMASAPLDEGSLVESLAFVFNEGLVCSLSLAEG
jgi:hypothetical protein